MDHIHDQREVLVFSVIHISVRAFKKSESLRNETVATREWLFLVNHVKEGSVDGEVKLIMHGVEKPI